MGDSHWTLRPLPRLPIPEPRVKPKRLRWFKHDLREIRMSRIQNVVSLHRHNGGRSTQDGSAAGGDPCSTVHLRGGNRSRLIPTFRQNRPGDLGDRHRVWNGYRGHDKIVWKGGVMHNDLEHCQRPGGSGIDDFATRRVPPAAGDGGTRTIISWVSTGVQPICFDHRTPCSSCVRTDRTRSRPLAS